jgi:hypothetical protein
MGTMNSVPASGDADGWLADWIVVHAVLRLLLDYSIAEQVTSSILVLFASA